MDASRLSFARPREKAHQQMPKNVSIAKMVATAFMMALIPVLLLPRRAPQPHDQRHRGLADKQPGRLLQSCQPRLEKRCRFAHRYRARPDDAGHACDRRRWSLLPCCVAAMGRPACWIRLPPREDYA